MLISLQLLSFLIFWLNNFANNEQVYKVRILVVIFLVYIIIWLEINFTGYLNAFYLFSLLSDELVVQVEKPLSGVVKKKKKIEDLLPGI